MIWVLVDIAVGLMAFVVLGLVGWRLFRHAKALTRAVGTASATLGDATSAISTPRPRAGSPRAT